MSVPTLPFILRINASTSAVAGIVLLMGAQSLAPWFGQVPAWIYQWVGAFLCLFALGAWLIQRRLPTAIGWVRWIFALDLLWIAATPVVMLFYAQMLSPLLHTLLALTALVVIAFACGEHYWIGRSNSAV